jgi:putative NIF3 family GTP cyclohydrolase 1 type 2
LPETSDVFALARKWAADLDIPHMRVISDGNKPVRKVFCASGSGMSYLPQAIQYGADVMLTGDVRYHAAREALEFGIPVIDAGHYGLEKMAVRVLLEAFKKEFLRMNVNMDLFACDKETEPFVEVYNP